MEDFEQEHSSLEYLFETALTLHHDERINWLTDQCKGNQEKVKEVVELLESHEKAQGFLSKHAGKDIQASFPDFTQQTVGAYKIDRLIAKGGMGNVYLGHRDDGEFQKQVAIKLVESLQVNNELFKRERQILADLKIPNVVTLLDGGTTDNGYPYIVMEYIEGSPIDKYVHKLQLGEQQIIELLIKLSKTVHKANNCGIIHCDLKPGNILINEEGVLKLMDFGISRVVNHDSQKEFDANICKAMTPEYSSPQRCQNNIPAITDDVYSLGIIMGTLFSNQQPVLVNDNEGGVHRSSAKVLSDQIQDVELKAILNKATADDPEARYTSAYAFATDLQCKLDNGCVTALKGNFFYRITKTIQNHWAKLITLVFLLALIISVPFLLYILDQKNKDAEEANEVLTKMIGNIQGAFKEYHTVPLLRSTQLEYAIEQTKGYESVTINKNLARLFVLMGEASGHPYALSQKNLDKSKVNYRRAVELYEKLIPKREDKVKAIEDYTRAKRHLAVVIAYDGQMQEGLSMMKDIRKRLEDTYEENQVPDSQRFLLGFYAMTEAFGQMHQENYDDASQLLDYAGSFINTNIDDENKAHRVFYHELRGHLGYLQDKLPEAKHSYHKVITDFASVPLSEWKIIRSIGRAHQGLGCIYLNDGNLDEGVKQFKQAQTTYMELFDEYSYINSIRKRAEVFQNFDYKDMGISIDELALNMSCKDIKSFIIPPRSQ